VRLRKLQDESEMGSSRLERIKDLYSLEDCKQTAISSCAIRSSCDFAQIRGYLDIVSLPAPFR